MTEIRGTASTAFRNVRCKDCLREQLVRSSGITDGTVSAGDLEFEYSEAWAARMIDRGGSRTDRCLYHRQVHRQAIQGLAVPYIDVRTIGVVADRTNPGGPLGGLGELPAAHRPKSSFVDLSKHKFGMTDADIMTILEKLSDPAKRVLILKAGTGTGKSTFGPCRLMNPPDGAPLRLTDFGPIVVTEPRVQATIGVATYVGERLVVGCPWRVCKQHGRFIAKPQDFSHTDPGVECTVVKSDAPWSVCSVHGRFIADEDIVLHPGEITSECDVVDCSDHIGPGYPVGYQVKGAKNHDDGCQLVYVTDGTMINWLREGRLNKIGAVIVDEAHERSTNIDFVLGYLNRELDRYPHLRVIVTSATFDVPFYVDYFGGESKVEWHDVPAVKTFGYGAPLFPISSTGELDCACEPGKHPSTTDYDAWRQEHWPEANRYGPPLADGFVEDLWETTDKLHSLRFGREIPGWQWKKEMPTALARFLVELVNGLDQLEVFGDVLAFLPTEAKIRAAVDEARAAIGERADVFGLLAATEPDEKERALAARKRGDRRKVVVSTNLAETSLTVEGVRFVVDSGLIAQSEWNATIAAGSVPTLQHSQAGIRQRWGRVGRDAPGWVFPLYTRAEFDKLRKDTPPGSTRSNLEQLIMTAKAGGVDDIEAFPWPAAYDHPSLDAPARAAMGTFMQERSRATSALAANGAVDDAGDITPYGRDLQQFTTGRSPAFAMAIIFADQLACVPEVVSAVALMEGVELRGESVQGRECLLLDNGRWPVDWKAEARWRHAALATGCEDDLDLVLRILAAWEAIDPDVYPWVDSPARQSWAHHWWLSHQRLLAAAQARHEVLGALSPGMNEEVKRLLDPRLRNRVRAVICRAMRSFEYQLQGDGTYLPSQAGELATGRLAPIVKLERHGTDRVLSLARSSWRDEVTLKNIVRSLPWAMDGSPSAMDLLLRASDGGPPAGDPIVSMLTSWPVGARVEARVDAADAGRLRVGAIEGVGPGRAFPGWEAESADVDPESSDDTEATDLLEDEVEVVGESTPLDEELASVDEIEGRWPTGTRRPDDDAELVGRREVLDPADPESNLETNDIDDIPDPDTEPQVDAMAKLAEANLRDVGRHEVEVVGECRRTDLPVSLLCIGYRIDQGGTRVLVVETPVPSAVERPWESDAEFGTELPVAAGPLLDDTVGVRLLFRNDGSGQFYVADRGVQQSTKAFELAASVDPRSNDFIRNLAVGDVMSAVVVPDRLEQPSVTLLPWQRHQLAERSDRRDDGLLLVHGTVLSAPPGKPAKVAIALESTASPLTFHVAPPVVARADFVPEPEMPVQLLLQAAPRSHLVVSENVAAELAAAYPDWFAWAPSGSGGEVTALRPIPTELYQRLTRVRSDQQWPRKLAAWFVGSHHLVVESMWAESADLSTPVRRLRELPAGSIVEGRVVDLTDNRVVIELADGSTGVATRDSLDWEHGYSVGESVAARVERVERGAGRYVVHLHGAVSASVEMPGYWASPAWELRSELAELAGCPIFIKKPVTLKIEPRSTAQGQTAVSAVLDLLACPAAIIEIPVGSEALVRGRQQANVNRWRTTEGVVYCAFPRRDSRELTVIARTVEVLRHLIADVVDKATIHIATVDAADDISAVAERYSSVRVLGRTEDDLGWRLQVKNDAVLRSFQKAVGAKARIVETRTAVVRDAASGDAVADWSTFEFKAPPVEVTREMREALDLSAAADGDEVAETTRIDGEALSEEGMSAIALMLTAKAKPSGFAGRWLEDVLHRIVDQRDEIGSEDDVARLVAVELGSGLTAHGLEEISYSSLGPFMRRATKDAGVARTSTKLADLLRPHLAEAGMHHAGHHMRLDSAGPRPEIPETGGWLDELLDRVAAHREQVESEGDVARILVVELAPELSARGLEEISYSDLGVFMRRLLNEVAVERTDTKLAELFRPHLADAGLHHADHHMRLDSAGPRLEDAPGPAKRTRTRRRKADAGEEGGLDIRKAVEASVAVVAATATEEEAGTAYVAEVASAMNAADIDTVDFAKFGQGFTQVLNRLGLARSSRKLSSLLGTALRQNRLRLEAHDLRRMPR